MAIYDNGVKAPIDPVTAARITDDRLMEAMLKRPGRSIVVAAQYRLWCSRMTAGGLDPDDRRAVLILKNVAQHYHEKRIDALFLVTPWDFELNARRRRLV